MTSEADTLSDDNPPSGQGRLQHLWHRLLDDDPNDSMTLQSHITERLSKKKELWAFFLFSFGYSAWSNTTGSVFQPLLVQQVARNASRLSSDPTLPCPEDDALIPEGERCLVPFGFARVEPTSYVLLINVVSVWCTIIVSLGTSAFADHGRSSKKLMMTFCTLLALTTSFMFIAPLDPDLWWLAGLLMVIGLIFSGATLNFFDAHIPILARHHPKVVRAMVECGENSREYVVAKVKMATFLSGGASAAGYAGGVVLTILGSALLLLMGAETLVIGYCLIMSAVYVLIFMVIYAFLSHQRTSPPLPKGASYLTFGYVRIAKTVRQARRLKTMFHYLCAWFILGDGLTSTASMAILIAQDQFQASNDALLIAVLIQRLCCRHNPVGLKNTWEMYMIAVVFGTFVGAIYSSNMVVFSQFIPLGHENELFALFEMTNVTSSWIGPLVCAAIIESFGIRHTYWFLVPQYYIPAIMMFFVDVNKGRQEAIDFYNDEQEEKKKVGLKKGGGSDDTDMELSDAKFVEEAKAF
ncbi:Autophagy protein 22 [Haplosporangium gracile]|nr:Autophagy protein 22 [Haplosporangium gracile]